MISQEDITKAFGEVRNQLRLQHVKDNARKEGKAKEDADNLLNLFLIGLLVGESLVTDIKRIADALDGGNNKQGIAESLYEIAMNTQPRG